MGDASVIPEGRPDKRPATKPLLLRWLDRSIWFGTAVTALIVLSALGICIGVPLWCCGGWVWEGVRPNPAWGFEMTELPAGGEVFAVVFSSDGKFLAAATRGSDDPRKADLGSEIFLWE